MSSLRKLALCMTLSFSPIFGVGCATNFIRPLTPSRGTAWQASLNEARLAESHQDWQYARRCYQNAHRQNPGNFESLHRLGVVCTQQKQFQDADNYFRQAITLSPEDPALLADMGFSAFMRNDYARAEAYLERSVRLNDKDPNTVNNLAIARAWSGKDELSLSTFRSVNNEQESLRQLRAIQIARGTRPTVPSVPSTPSVPSDRSAPSIANRDFPVIPVFPASSSEISASKVERLPPPTLTTNERSALYTIELPAPSEQEVSNREVVAIPELVPESEPAPLLEFGTRQAIGQPVPPLHSSPASQPIDVSLQPPSLPPIGDIEVPNSVEEPSIIPPIPGFDESIAMDNRLPRISIPRESPTEVDPSTELADNADPIAFPLPFTTTQAPDVVKNDPIEDQNPVVDERSTLTDSHSSATDIEEGVKFVTITSWRKTRLPIGMYSAGIPKRAQASSVHQASSNSDLAHDTGACRICLVTLYDRRTLTPGHADFRVVYDSRTYRFATKQARDRFVVEPHRYLPASRGMDVVSAGKGEHAVSGSFNFACRYQNQLYLFATSENAEEFRRDPQKYALDY